MPFPRSVLASSTMRCSQSRANGQWLQVKITSVPALPVTSAIDSILPSTFFIFVFATAAGTFAPSARPPVLSPATGGARRRAVRTAIAITVAMLASFIVSSC